MKAKDLVTTPPQSRAFYIDGDDLYWVDFAVRYFAALIPEEYREFNLKIIDTLSSVGQIAAAANTFSMFPCETVVIVKDSSYKEKAGDIGILEALVKDSEGVYLVLCGKNLITTAALRKVFERIDANRLDAGELREHIRGLLPSGGIRPDAAELLITYCNRNMAAINSELIKLKAYKNGEVITAADVRLNVADTTDNEIYELSNALALRNNARAYEIMDRFISRNVAYAFMLAALANQYRRMLYAALSPLSDAELAAKTGANEYAVKKAREAAGKYTKSRLKNSLDALTEAELAFKSGVMSEDTAFKTAVSKLLIG